jgi:hypothetical protein
LFWGRRVECGLICATRSIIDMEPSYLPANKKRRAGDRRFEARCPCVLWEGCLENGPVYLPQWLRVLAALRGIKDFTFMIRRGTHEVTGWRVRTCVFWIHAVRTLMHRSKTVLVRYKQKTRPLGNYICASPNHLPSPPPSLPHPRVLFKSNIDEFTNPDWEADTSRRHRLGS